MGGRDKQAETRGQGRKEEAGLPQGSLWHSYRDARAGRGARQPLGAGKTHHWLSRGKAGSILSPTKGPGSAISVLVLLRLLEPCLRAALVFSSRQGEVRPYPSPSDGPARQTDVAAGGGDRLVSHLSPPPRHGGSPQKEPQPHHITPGPLALPCPLSSKPGSWTSLPQHGQGWVPTTPEAGSSQRPSPWTYFPRRFQKLRGVLLMHQRCSGCSTELSEKH